MIEHKNRHSRLFKTIAIGVVCLFLFNQTAWACSADTLAPAGLGSAKTRYELLKLGFDAGNEGQAEYLAEEAYLEHARSTGKEEEDIVAFIEDHARQTFGADEDADKKAHLDNMLRNIRRQRTAQEKEQARELEDLLKMPAGLGYDVRPEPLPGKNLSEVAQLIPAEGAPLRHKDMVVLPKQGTLYVIGDTHADPHSLEHILGEINFRERVRKGERIYLTFSGDYAHGGLNNIDLLLMLLNLKREFPRNIVLMSGNHEFSETYLNALKQCYQTHWDYAKNDPFPCKVPREGTHYTHLRLELISRFGVEKGEEIHRLFEAWGRSLPYVCFTGNGLMMSHSVGLSKEFQTKDPDFEDLAAAKQDPEDLRQIRELGFGAWKAPVETNDGTLHAMMVNNFDITPQLLDKFGHLGVTRFAVGHAHYRSGDVDHDGRIITVYASGTDSPSAGQFNYQQMVVESRTRKADGQEGVRHKEQRPGDASPCYLEIDLSSDSIDLARSKREVKNVAYTSFRASMAALKEKVKDAYRTAPLEKESADYRPSAPQTLVLYAEPLLENGGVLNLEDTLRLRSMAENNILGNVIVFAEDPGSARLMEMLLEDINRDLKNKITVTTVTKGRLEEEFHPGDDEAKEVDAILAYANRHIRGVSRDNILGVIKGISRAPQALHEGLKTLQINVPVVVFRAIKGQGLYSLAEAVQYAIAAKKRGSGWFIELAPARAVTPDIQEEFNRYREHLRLLVAA